MTAVAVAERTEPTAEQMAVALPTPDSLPEPAHPQPACDPRCGACEVLASVR